MIATIECENIAPEAVTRCELSELVRGNDCSFVDEMTPVVRSQTVALDLSSVERIDAAGIAALISLYRAARESGHCFYVSNVAPRVRELLQLVGLERLLLSHNAASSANSASGLVQNAA